MKHFRVSVDFDIEAASRDEASAWCQFLCSFVERNLRQVIEALPNGIEERIPLPKPRKG